MAVTRPDVAAVVLAAGKGTRFRSDLAKVLHPAAGRTLLRHVLETVRPLGLGQVVVVVGHQAGDVEAEAKQAGIDGLVTIPQEQQRGTGHAVEVGLDALDDRVREVLVLPGDAPLLHPATVAGLLDGDTAAAGTFMTTALADPTGYGRIVRSGEQIERIVEESDATPEQRAIREVNAGIYVFEREPLQQALAQLGTDNAQGELYLTDVAEILRSSGAAVAAHLAPAEEVAGVNDRLQLAAAAAVLRERKLAQLATEVGVTIIDPATTYVDVDVDVGRDTVLLPGCVLETGTSIGEAAVVGPNCRLVACDIGDGAEVTYSVLHGAVVGAHATVGPFTYLRPGARLERGAKAGGFVEIKQSTVGEGSKVPHLSYVGDTTSGSGVNVGAGTVTVNYDGYAKHRTEIGDGAFVGSDSMLVAPVRVGRGAVVAAGSTITDDVPDDALAIGRARQVLKEGWAAQRRARHGK